MGQKIGLRFVAAALVLATASGPASQASAQVQGSGAAVPASPPSSADETDTEALNRAAASAAARQQQENLDQQAQYDQASRDHAAAVAANNAAMDAERRAYEAALDANAQARANYDAAYARWQADVLACRRGERARCASSAPSPR